MSALSFTFESYRKLLGQRKLMASRCLHCGQLYLPPRPFCGVSASRQMEWLELSGRGKVLGFTEIRVAGAEMSERGFGADRPYISGYVALAEGLAIPARLETSQAWRVGAEAIADFQVEDRGGESQATLIFRPI